MVVAAATAIVRLSVMRYVPYVAGYTHNLPLATYYLPTYLLGLARLAILIEGEEEKEDEEIYEHA